jgi:osmoprotectant transport system substrate-binding protein
MKCRQDLEDPVPHPFDLSCRKGGKPQRPTGRPVTRRDFKGCCGKTPSLKGTGFSPSGKSSKIIAALDPGGSPAPRITAYTLALTTLFLLTSCSPPRPSHPVIGAKNFTEQVILSELLAQEIEAHSHLKVERRFYLAGSYICHQALVSGRIDAYVEYTGTALTAILKQPLSLNTGRNPDSVFNTVRTLYASRYHVTAGDPLGFENTFAMVIRDDDAERLHLRTLSEAARFTPQWKLGVGYEFEQRPDGLPGLSAAYGLHFNGSPRTMDLGLLYRALTARQVDMIAANSTDGPIAALHLVALQDDRHYFPPYQAVPLVREETLARWPEIRTALRALAGRITADDMRAMNDAVDGQHRDPAAVVREFRARKGL